MALASVQCLLEFLDEPDTAKRFFCFGREGVLDAK